MKAPDAREPWRASYPEEIRTLGDIVGVHARRHGEAIALEFAGRQTSYRTLDAQVGRAAGALRASGAGPGSRVAICDRKSDLFFELLFACGRIGAILVPINWRLTTYEMSYVLSDAEPAVVFASAALAQTVRDGLTEAALHAVLVILDADPEGCDGYEGWRDAPAPDCQPIEAAPEDVALILYTSGTTGQPKGAMLSHGALLQLRRVEARQGPEWLQWRTGEACLVCMPLFHIGGLRTAVCALFNGASVLVIPQFEVAELLNILGSRPITKLFVVPSALQAMVRHPLAKALDFRNVKYVIYGASPISAALLAEAIQTFPCGFIQAYGSMETAGAVLTLGPPDHDPAAPLRMSSAGKPVSGVEVRIISPEGAILPTGSVGELVVRSPSNMNGYWRRPEESRETLGAGGWLRTGDAGLMDEDGYIPARPDQGPDHQRRGERLSARGGERARQPSAVREAAVVGTQSEVWGEKVGSGRGPAARRAGLRGGARPVGPPAGRRLQGPAEVRLRRRPA